MKIYDQPPLLITCIPLYKWFVNLSLARTHASAHATNQAYFRHVFFLRFLVSELKDGTYRIGFKTLFKLEGNDYVKGFEFIRCGLGRKVVFGNPSIHNMDYEGKETAISTVCHECGG